jgi:hypothetical protein
VWWIWILAGIAALAAAAGAIHGACSVRHRRRQYAEAARVWRETPAERRLDALRALLARRETNAPAWYLTGVELLRAGDTKEAARAFGMAHHADCGLESAALLAFACLKAAPGLDSDVVQQMAVTWHEMREPAIPAHRDERELLTCLEAAAPAPRDLPPLGRVAWLTVGPALHAKVEQVFAPRQRV